jgi:hypothetical protein
LDYFIEGPGAPRHLVDSEHVDPKDGVCAVHKIFVPCLNFEAVDCLRRFYCFYPPSKPQITKIIVTILPAAVFDNDNNFYDLMLNLFTEFFVTEDSRRLGCEAV